MNAGNSLWHNGRAGTRLPISDRVRRSGGGGTFVDQRGLHAKQVYVQYCGIPADILYITHLCCCTLSGAAHTVHTVLYILELHYSSQISHVNIAGVESMP